MPGFRRFVGGLVMVGLAALSYAADARAGFVNGGFEATPEFSGWQRVGDTNVVMADFDISPTEGTNQALVANRTGSSVTTGALETLLGVVPGTLSSLAGGDVVAEGSVIRQAGIGAEPGLGFAAFDVNFLTDEIPGTPLDFSFVITMTSTGTSATQVVGASALSFIPAPLSTGFLQQTGYRTYFVPVPTTGTFDFAIGVVDVGDALLDSAILVDNIRLVSAVPGPSSVILMGLGTLGMIGHGWWRRRAPEA